MQPRCEITIDGSPATSTLTSRLISCSVTDEEGISSDQVEIELNDDTPAQIPRIGAVIGVKMGYEGALSDMGEFIAQDIEVLIRPFQMRIIGKSADLGGKSKTQRERHWDNITIGKLVAQIASENGLASAVAPELASFTYPWIGQNGESDVAFLERLSRNHGAIFSIKARTIIFAVRGSGVSPLGSLLTSLVLDPLTVAPGSCRVSFSQRARFLEVVAVWQDRAGGKRREVTVPCDPQGEGTHTMDQPFGSEATAREGAKAKALELRRKAITFTAEIIGNPAARGGAPVIFQGMRPEIDGRKFIINSANHRFSKDGYKTAVAGSIQP